MSRLRHQLLLISLVLFLPVLAFAGGSFTGNFSKTKFIASTVPANGDVNPYGVFVVPRSTGKLVRGHILVSNFNNAPTTPNPSGEQGTGTTIMDIAPDGTVKIFATINAQDLPGPCPGGVGLTTALVVLRSGWVIVGSLPTSDGTSATAQAGCLIVLNRWGHVVKTFSGGAINGPWDMTVLDADDVAELFVTNVLNGTVAASPNTVNGGTVLRILLVVPDEGAPFEVLRTVIGSGFMERTDPAALVIGPTGVGLGLDGTLYVADTLANRIAAIPNAVFRLTSAGTGKTVSTDGGLNGPLGLAIAPNGNILTVNSNDGNLVETTPGGVQFTPISIDTSGTPGGAGTLFGLAVAPGGKGIYFVDDGDNTLDLFH
jgi:hypothetical protein